MTGIRKTIVTREIVLTEMGQTLKTPITRAIGIAVVTNPYAGRFAADLRPMYEIGRTVGNLLVPELVPLLKGPAVSYGKGALVGVDGEHEHGGACIHPMLGKPMREAIGGGKAVIVSNVKIGPPGAVLDVPLGHKDEVASFDHFDTVSVMVQDAPRPNEIAVVVVLADGGRPIPRCGTGPIR